MTKSPKVVLIAFKFWPYAGVGALRWLKMVKYFVAKGVPIEIITAEWGDEKDKPEFLKSETVVIHRIPTGYPHKLKYWRSKSRAFNFLKSLPFRLLDRLVFFDDEAQRWQPALFKKLDEVASRGPVVLIATGAPFQANLLAARYKKQSCNTDLRLIQDFRDIWASNPYKKISLKVRRKILSWQEEALSGADAVVSVSETLRSQLLSEHSFANPKNFAVIENGFDPDDAIKDVVKTTQNRSTKKKIIHLGSVTNGRDRPLLRFLESLSQNQDFKNQIELQLVGSLPTPVLLAIQSKYQDLIDAGVVSIVGTVDRKQAHKMLLGADFALMLTSPEMSYALSAKIYEYLFFEIPTLSLNYGGEAEAFVKKRNMGLSVNLKVEKVDPVFSDLLARGRNGFTFDKIGISYPELVDKYLKLIGI